MLVLFVLVMLISSANMLRRKGLCAVCAQELSNQSLFQVFEDVGLLYRLLPTELGVN